MAVIIGKPKFEDVGDLHVWLETTKNGQVKMMSCKVGEADIKEEITIWTDGKITFQDGNLTR